MNYDISSAEKEMAEKAILSFNEAALKLNAASDHLNIMLTPFKDNKDITTEEIIENRAAERRFRDKSIENFNKFKIIAFHSINLLSPFSSDTQTSKLTKSFISTVEDLEKSVNKFSELFNNLDDKDFVSKIVSAIETIKKEIDQVLQIIEDRIKTHIQTNILGKTWANDISDQYNIDIAQKVPLLIELNQEREKQLSDLKNK